MRFVIFICLLALVSVVADSDHDHFGNYDWQRQYQIWRKRHHRHHSTHQQYLSWKRNVRHILEHNAQPSSYRMGTNHLTDLTLEEFRQRLCYQHESHPPPNNICEEIDIDLNKDVPQAIDWRSLGAVSSVKDQGQCGSCYSFSA